MSQQPPSAGWYVLGENPDDLGYFDGSGWTWRRWRMPDGEWAQQPILQPNLPPSAPVPAPVSSTPVGAVRHTAFPESPGGDPQPAAGWMSPAAPYYPGGPGYPGSAYGSWPSGPPAPAPGHLDLHLSEPQAQARWKTLLRGLLALPNAIVLGLVEIAVGVVTIVMWFAALITGRVPRAMWQFSMDAMQWSARLQAYLVFLTDRYPPFEIGNAPYPIWVTLEQPARFNRLSVLFRIILAIPAGIVTGVFTYGVYLFAIFTWVITLVLGRCPRSLHLMLSAWLRYQLRYSAYYGLLTTEYPSAPLGDRQSTTGSLETGEIVLRGSARALAVAAIVVGAGLYVGYLALPAILGAGARTRNLAIAQINGLDSRSIAAQTSYEHAAGKCSGTWRCVQNATPILSRNIQTQITTLDGIMFPTPLTTTEATSVVSVLQEERSTLLQMQEAGSDQIYETDVHHLVTLTQHLRPLAQRLVENLQSS